MQIAKPIIENFLKVYRGGKICIDFLIEVLISGRLILYRNTESNMRGNNRVSNSTIECSLSLLGG